MNEKVKFWQYPEVCLCLKITNFPLFVKVPSTVPAKDMYVLKWIRSETHFVVKISVPRETQYLNVNVSQKEKTTFSFEVFHIFHEQRLSPPPIYVLALSHCTKNTCRFLTKLSPFTMLILKDTEEKYHETMAHLLNCLLVSSTHKPASISSNFQAMGESKIFLRTLH